MGEKGSSKKRPRVEPGIELDILKVYDLKVKKVKIAGSGFKVKTERGDKFLKEFKGTEEEIKFVHGVLEHLARQGFYKIARFLPTKYGDAFVRYEDKFFYLTDWIEGKECSLKKPLNLEESIRTMAQLHKASEGILAEAESLDRLAAWPDQFQESLDEIQEFKNQAREKLFPTQFDQLFLEKADYFCEQILRTIEMLSQSRYRELVDEGQIKGVLCHRDFASGNLIRVRDGDIYIVDFDHCGYDLAMYDLSRFLGRYLPKHNWDNDVARFALNIYSSVQEITKEDYQNLMALMTFPRKFQRLAHYYYKHTKDWTEEEFLAKLNRVLKKEEARALFLASFSWK